MISASRIAALLCDCYTNYFANKKKENKGANEFGLSNFSELLNACGVSESGCILFLPVPPYCFLRHDIHITVLQFNNGSLADWLSLQKPLIMNGVTLSITQTQSHHLLPLRISMKTNSALVYIIVVIALRSQVL